MSQTFGLPGELAPLSAEALAEFEAKQARAGIVYISRIPPAMRPSKVRHLMSGFGAVGRVYLQQEDPKRAYLRRKHTSTKKAHFTEGWVEFLDKRAGRAVAEMLNGQPIGGKKGTRFRDDVWTMKYLPKFKWNMLTEQIAHETASHAARLRVELSQSRTEQKDYLKNVELARVLAKRAERKRAQNDLNGGENGSASVAPSSSTVKASPSRAKVEAPSTNRPEKREKKRRRTEKAPMERNDTAIEDVLSSVF
ncbi:hypothetical protein DL93DRAFT_2064926 [Clavulina sp. PMI_390]|nr:hypothetical protein DL93DRAFT_2064926 [Clavulina sp. PMI_390]